MSDLPRYDAHTHTTYSDGKNSVLDNARQAEAAGLEAVAITDHIFGPVDWLPGYLAEIEVAGRQVAPLVIAGGEAVIAGPSGELSVQTRDVADLSLVLADLGGSTEGVGRDSPLTLEELVRTVVDCYVNACEHPYLDALAHPFNLGRFEARLSPEDLPRRALETVAEVMVRHDVAFEVMNQMSWWFPDLTVPEFSQQYYDLVLVFRDAGVKFLVGSDAHSCGAVGALTWSDRLLRAAQIPRNQIVNLAALKPHRERQETGGRR
jgi:histidinol phosphatase-like PHP family hydrolase